MTAGLVIVIAYLLGSIPFGLIVTRISGGPDLRAVGSGNIGATNVLRTGNKKLAALTLVGDALKGTVAVLLAAHFAGPDAALAAGFFAFIGHLFPIWAGFKGGKGIATYIGLLIGLAWPGALIFAAIWLIVACLSRYSSLAALSASALTPAALWLRKMPSAAALFLVLSVITWIMHRANIRRLLDGSEGKIGARSA
jgi:glycerol-3-phosphate acyltransferase PlsY